eukprot:111380_1
MNKKINNMFKDSFDRVMSTYRLISLKLQENDNKRRQLCVCIDRENQQLNESMGNVLEEQKKTINIIGKLRKNFRGLKNNLKILDSDVTYLEDRLLDLEDVLNVQNKKIIHLEQKLLDITETFSSSSDDDESITLEINDDDDADVELNDDFSIDVDEK